jgi:tetratricopeptide (TPR) repeat protein
LKAVPDHPELLLVQGMLLQESDKYAEALERYQKVIRIERGYRDKQAPEYNIGSLAQAYFNQGVALDKQGKFEDAIDSMKKVLEVQPGNAEAANYIGYSYADKGIRLDDAKRYMEDALKQDPENPYYLDSMGWVLFKRGDDAGAQAALEKAAQLLKTSQKDDAAIFDHLAQVYLKRGEKQRAVAQWKKAAELDPSNKDFPQKIQDNSAPGL